MEQELYHYGILGMKWGIRRYQNKDGSLTEAGRKRYSGSIGKQKLAEDISQIESKVRKLESKKSTSRNTSEVEFLKKMKSGLVKELDGADAERGKEYINDMFDKEIRAQKDKLLEDAKLGGKFEMTFVEAIQNDYDDSGLTEEEQDRDILDRYESYLYNPSAWLKINSEYHGLSNEKAADKIYKEMMKDTGGFDKIDDPELYDLMLMEYGSILETAGLDSEAILPLARKKFEASGKR